MRNEFDGAKRFCNALSIEYSPKRVEELINALEPRLRLVLALRFGLCDLEFELEESEFPRTLHEIAGLLNLSVERVRQLEAIGISQLENLL